MRMQKGRTVSEAKRKTRETCVEGLAFPKSEAKDFLLVCEVFCGDVGPYDLSVFKQENRAQNCSFDILRRLAYRDMC